LTSITNISNELVFKFAYETAGTYLITLIAAVVLHKHGSI